MIFWKRRTSSPPAPLARPRNTDPMLRACGMKNDSLNKKEMNQNETALSEWEHVKIGGTRLLRLPHSGSFALVHTHLSM